MIEDIDKISFTYDIMTYEPSDGDGDGDVAFFQITLSLVLN